MDVKHVIVLNRAVDGNRAANYWQNSCSHTMDEDSPWLVIYLRDPCEVTHVKIQNRGDCCSELLKLSVISKYKFLTYRNWLIYVCYVYR